MAGSDTPNETAREVTYWLRTEGGAARRITPAGLLLGRAPSSDVVLQGATASRRQALVYLGEEGPEVAVMGRGEVLVDGARIPTSHKLQATSQLVVAGSEFGVFEEVRETEVETPLWVLEAPGGELFSFSKSRFQVGGGDDDDLRIETLAPNVLAFVAEGGRLSTRAKDTMRVDGKALAVGRKANVRANSTIEIGGQTLRVVAGGDLLSGSTLAVEPAGTAQAVKLEFLPRGGRLTVTVDGDERSVYLPDRRCDFVAVLIAPPGDVSAGDFVSDELVWNRVWGKKPSGKKTLNVLLHRLRRDLDRVGLDGSALLERLGSGGATRFAVAENAVIRVD